MMKKTRLALMIGGLLLGAASATVSAARLSADEPAARAAVAQPAATADVLARRGRGSDDPKPPACDDHGTDVCNSEA